MTIKSNFTAMILLYYLIFLFFFILFFLIILNFAFPLLFYYPNYSYKLTQTNNNLNLVYLMYRRPLIVSRPRLFRVNPSAISQFKHFHKFILHYLLNTQSFGAKIQLVKKNGITPSALNCIAAI